MTLQEIAELVAELRDTAEGERHAWGNEDTHFTRLWDRAAALIEALAKLVTRDELEGMGFRCQESAVLGEDILLFQHQRLMNIEL
jgi:hypothetical protein